MKIFVGDPLMQSSEHSSLSTALVERATLSLALRAAEKYDTVFTAPAAVRRASERVSDLVDLDNHPHRNTTTGYCVLQMK